MNSANSKNIKKLLTLEQAAKKLGVSVETLLEWNEHHILKPTITAKGTIGYSVDQLNQFLKARRTMQPDETAEAEVIEDDLETAELQPETPDEEATETQVQEAEVVTPSTPLPQTTPSVFITPSQAPVKITVFQRFVKWIGDDFYSAEFIKAHLKSQVKDSLSFSFKVPARSSIKLPHKRYMGLAVVSFAIFGTFLFTEQYRISVLIQDVQNSVTKANENDKQVLGESTSKLKISGSVLFKLPVVFKERVSAEKDVQVGKNLAVGGTGTFKGNVTAPNLLYGIVAGDNIVISGDKQRPTISVEIPEKRYRTLPSRRNW